MSNGPFARVRLTGPTGQHWAGLDVFRGTAAVLMILNHTAVRAMPGSGSFVVALGFVGSFAPVLFFFATGFGAGVQSARTAQPGGQLLARSVILFIADAFLWAGPGRWIGMDFFGFIAMAGLITHAIRQLPRSGAVAVGLAVVVAGFRFAIGPAVRPRLAAEEWAGFFGFVFGTDGLSGFSYPLAPWLTFPLMGYALGRLAALRREIIVRHPWRFVIGSLATAGLLTGVAAVAVTYGAALHRWGTMSLAYFVTAWAAVLVGLPLSAGAVERTLRRGGRWIGLNGVRSFAVVPLHYLLLAAIVATFGPIAGLIPFAGTTILVVVGSFAGSTVIPQAAGRAARVGLIRRVRVIAWVGVMAAGLAVVLGTCDGLWNVTARAGGQLLLCLLLSLPKDTKPTMPPP